MKKFILEVQEGYTKCGDCPFCLNDNYIHICDYLKENNICKQYNFEKLNIEEYNERY